MTISILRRARATLFVLVCSVCMVGATSGSQETKQRNTSQDQPHAGSGVPLSFEVASVRPNKPGESVSGWGFRSLPGGKVDIGAISGKQLIADAFHVIQDQIKGGPPWLTKESYGITAIPPATSQSKDQRLESSTPTAEQRLMMQSLLADRFGFRFHENTQLAWTYVLIKGSGPLKLKSPVDASRRPAFVMFMGDNNEYNGSTRGANVSMQQVAENLSFELNTPVIDNTGLSGSYDFSVEPFTSENDSPDVAAAGAMHRLGLKLKRVRGPVRVIVIDDIREPTPN